MTKKSREDGVAPDGIPNDALIVLLIVNPIDPIIETYLCKRVVIASRPQREQRRTVDDSDMIYIVAVERPTPDACQLAGVSSIVWELHATPITETRVPRIFSFHLQTTTEACNVLHCIRNESISH